MTKFKYLYLDDENDASTAAIADGLKILNLIDVVPEEPREFGNQMVDLRKRLNEFDGLILDLRLDGKKLNISYNAPAIAQELRKIAAEGGIKSCPIILCSTDEKMKATYEVEKICHEHFDYTFTKQSSSPWEKFAKKLASLANGYHIIPSLKGDLHEILKRSDLEILDPRILENFIGFQHPLPVYEYASFIIKDLFHQQGPLIKESLLAARLGIDINESKDWQKLLDHHFIAAKYIGIFSDGWTRWWADLIIQRFKEISGGQRLNMLNADERIKLLIKITGISNLVAAKPTKYNRSSNFWSICEAFKTPLDPLEGFKIHTSIEPKSWQEHKFISLEAVLEKKGPKPHSSELYRINLLKEELKAK